MGWFSNPNCTRCGRELTVGTDGLEDYLHCVPCLVVARQERDEKASLLRRIEKLESDKLKEMEQSKTKDW
jgi:hypothetical protein